MHPSGFVSWLEIRLGLSSGRPKPKLIKGARAVLVKDGPHCITWTHADEVNQELVNFLGAGKRAGAVLEKEAVA